MFSIAYSQKMLLRNRFWERFYLAVNKLITDKTQNILSLIAEHSGSIKYSLDKLGWIIQINGIIFIIKKNWLYSK